MDYCIYSELYHSIGWYIRHNFEVQCRWRLGRLVCSSKYSAQLCITMPICIILWWWLLCSHLKFKKRKEWIFSKFCFVSIDIVLLKVNSQKAIEWITSLDFNNDLDSYSSTLDYGPYLYWSISSGSLNLYYCLAEIYLDSGIVSNSRWFKVLNQVFIKLMKINVVIVSEDHLFIYQDIYPNVKYALCVIIFDRSNFAPLMKFDFVEFNFLSYNYFYVNQKYYIFGYYLNNINIIIIDSSLNYITFSKVFESSLVNIYNNYLWVVLYNNMFIITQSGPMRGLQQSTISNIIFHKESLDYKSMSNETFINTNDDSFTTGYRSKGLKTGFIFENASIGKFIKLII